MTRDQIRVALGPVWDCLEEHRLIDQAVERIRQMLIKVPVIITNETALRIGINSCSRITEDRGVERLVSIVEYGLATSDEMVGRSPSALEIQRAITIQGYS